MNDANLLRLIIALFGAAALILLYFFGQPRKPKQGERLPRKPTTPERVEPSIGNTDEAMNEGLDPATKHELDRLGEEIRGQRAESEAAAPEGPVRSSVGARSDDGYDRIVTLHVAARPGETVGGPELMIAAEKIGLEYGDLGIFHRLPNNPDARSPVFSVVNMVKPGHFDPATISELRTPGVTFFMTLPGPLSALDAFDVMLPAAERLAELLDASVLDEERNALGRQTIQHLRDELRVYDREREKHVIKKRW